MTQPSVLAALVSGMRGGAIEVVDLTSPLSSSTPAPNMWTTRHGTLIGPDTTVVQVDDDPSALGAHRPIHQGVTGDAELTARRTLAVGDSAGETRIHRQGYRTADTGAAIAARVRWRDVPYDDESDRERIDRAP